MDRTVREWLESTENKNHVLTAVHVRIQSDFRCYKPYFVFNVVFFSVSVDKCDSICYRQWL